MYAALLPERGVVKVAGDDARKFLNGLLTADIAKVTPQSAAFAALLTPQGKIMVDMIVAEAPPKTAAASSSIARARSAGRSPTGSISTNCAPRCWSRTCPRYSA